MTQDMTTTSKNVTAVDREMMSYVHNSQLRHKQLKFTYSHYTDSDMREHELAKELLRSRQRRYAMNLTAFMHYKTRKVLEEQADLVTKFGQAGVNAALGDGADQGTPKHGDEQKFNTLNRKITMPEMLSPVPRHLVTARQRWNDRFDRKIRTM